MLNVRFNYASFVSSWLDLQMHTYYTDMILSHQTQLLREPHYCSLLDWDVEWNKAMVFLVWLGNHPTVKQPMVSKALMSCNVQGSPEGRTSHPWGMCSKPWVNAWRLLETVLNPIYLMLSCLLVQPAAYTARKCRGWFTSWVGGIEGDGARISHATEKNAQFKTSSEKLYLISSDCSYCRWLKL